MSTSKNLRGANDLTDEELAGFVQLLLAGRELPEVTGEILAYVERVAGQTQVDEDSVFASVRAARATLVRQRLEAAHPRPVRPLGTHLLAKRVEGRCQVDDVAVVIGERVEQLRAIEARAVSPLTLTVEKLATIAHVFGLNMAELREALLLEVSDPAGSRGLGTVFARSREGDFKSDALRIASDDLRRATTSYSESLEPSLTASIDATVRAVGAFLKREGLKRPV